LLAYMLTSSEEWDGATVRINVIVDSTALATQAETNLDAVIAKTRVRALPHVIVRQDKDETITEIVREVSGETDLVIMGLRSPAPDEMETFIDHVGQFICDLGSVLLVHASSHFDGRAVLFDEP